MDREYYERQQQRLQSEGRREAFFAVASNVLSGVLFLVTLTVIVHSLI